MGSFWFQLRHLFSGPQLPWMILWFGLAALIVPLIVLTRTNWGQSHPLQKCAAMSLLVHLLLAAYATTVEIVTAGSPDGNSDRGVVSISLVNDVGDTPEQSAATKEQSPWEKLLAGSSAVPEAMKLDHPEPFAGETAPSLLTADPLAATKPLLDKLPSMVASLVKPAADPTPSAAAPAKPIDVSPPRVPQKVAAIEPDAAGPDRVSTASNDKSAGDPEMHFAAMAKPQAIVPGPDAKDDGSSPLAPAAIATAASATSGSDASTANPRGADSGASRLVMVPVSGSAAKAFSDGRKEANGGAASGEVGEPEVYRDRTASDRNGILRRRGGSPETEAAVQAALKWLVANQSTDGHWDADRFGAGRETMTLGYNRNGAGAKADTAMTGLALLALLGSGNTHRDGPYADNVRRGLNYLLSVQASDGNLGGQAAMSAFMYSHGISSFAVSEDFAMTHDKRLEAPLRAAIGYTIARQHPTTGGWRYQPHETGDTSQLGWQLMALKSAELAGISMPEATRAGAMRFLGSVASGTSGGLASYRPNELPSRAMTAEALVCRQFLGMSRGTPSADEAGDYLLGELPSAQRINLYYWYYGTLAMYQLGGEHWQRWNSALQAALVDQQVSEGDMAGSWDPKCIWGGYGGRVYSTAMSALCLEIYYRFLPLYNAEQGADKH
jgi:Squalene-hopene cyclase C-terminal domain